MPVIGKLTSLPGSSFFASQSLRGIRGLCGPPLLLHLRDPPAEISADSRPFAVRQIFLTLIFLTSRPACNRGQTETIYYSFRFRSFLPRISMTCSTSGRVANRDRLAPTAVADIQ
jgi:hypothetical protein